VSSPAFPAGGAIPRQYTCDGRDISPPLRWTNVPGSAQQLSVVMRDADAPGGNFVHWRLTGIAPATRAIPTGVTAPGAKAGRNDFGTVGYRGPCPPRGVAHHYVITVEATSGGAVVGRGTLIGTYARR
jgi:Raf kinase inhibitor-like YbhB/YbcL family protein